MKTLFEYPLEANWDKRNKVVPEKVIRKAIRYELHVTMQDKLHLKEDNYCLFSNERFKYYLYTIEKNKMRRRETQKRARDKIKSASGTNDDSPASNIRIPEKARKYTKKNLQGKAIYPPPSARELKYLTPITLPTPTALAMMQSIQRRSLAAALLNATLSLRSSRNRINPRKG